MTSMLCTTTNKKSLINHEIYLFCKQKIFKIFLSMRYLCVLRDIYTNLFKISININLVNGCTNFFKHERNAFFLLSYNSAVILILN